MDRKMIQGLAYQMRLKRDTLVELIGGRGEEIKNVREKLAPSLRLSISTSLTKAGNLALFKCSRKRETIF
jgi:hypothetical protein